MALLTFALSTISFVSFRASTAIRAPGINTHGFLMTIVKKLLCIHHNQHMTIHHFGNRDYSYNCTSRLCLCKPRSSRKAADCIRRCRSRLFHLRDIHPCTDNCKNLGCLCNAHSNCICVSHHCTH